ncbi:hypothetical protein [Nocardia terpenica]|uniref:Uncharacterized protein n=1 Tax=Nocardia terpenica TaxID=455432 RepID=A0A6G9ZDF1_9NOCA|nr:hypothetical protein [Nocardia terpenica]QIS23649.1 hypothetical protein F6W96_40655 [Nocardia terpenica]
MGSSNDSDEDSVIDRIAPVEGSLFSGTVFDVASADLLDALGRVSAALPTAPPARTDRLRQLQRELAQCQRALDPHDRDGLTAAHDLCERVRAELAGER